MVRIAKDIISFATQENGNNPLLFLKQTFQPNFDTSTLDEKAKVAELPKVNLDVYYQIED